MNWTEQSEEWLRDAIAANPCLSKQQLRTWCRKNYPFASRRGYPYKCWLLVLRLYFKPESVKVIPPRPRMTRIERMEARGQLRLIP